MSPEPGPAWIVAHIHYRLRLCGSVAPPRPPIPLPQRLPVPGLSGIPGSPCTRPPLLYHHWVLGLSCPVHPGLPSNTCGAGRICCTPVRLRRDGSGHPALTCCCCLPTWLGTSWSGLYHTAHQLDTTLPTLGQVPPLLWPLSSRSHTYPTCSYPAAAWLLHELSVLRHSWNSPSMSQGMYLWQPCPSPTTASVALPAWDTSQSAPSPPG